MESIQLVLVVHVMILAAYITKCRVAHITLVDRLRVLASQVLTQRLRPRKALLADVAPIGDGLVDRPALCQRVLVQLLVLLQLETLVEGLAAHLTDGAHLAGVLPHVVEQVLLFAEHVATGVALVLNAPRVDGHVLLKAVEAGELARADGAAEEAAVVLLGVAGVVNLRNII